MRADDTLPGPDAQTPRWTPTVERSGGPADEVAVPPDLQLGRYKLLARIGRGGMGVVYTAWDEMLDRIVALKLLRADNSDGKAVGRFIREAQALARLAHPNVVTIHDVDHAGGRVFLAMEHVRGETLREVMARARGEGHAAVVELFLQAGRGLQAVHRAGLVHRDFKPENVMVGADGRVRVMDFGLVRRAHGGEADEVTITRDGALDANLTAFGAVVGTPAYMAPEQHHGAAVDARADVYSFCASLYEGLYGERPFAGETVGALDEEVPAPAGARVPGWLHAVVVRGLRSEPGRRWPDMDALLAALAADPAARRRRIVRWSALALTIAAVTVAATFAVIELRQRWAQARADALAAEHLAALEAGDEARAEAAFSAFVEDPAHAGTRALVWAWERRGDREREAGRTEAALNAYARAYVGAREPADAGAALRRIAEVYRATWRTEALGRVAAALEPDGRDAGLVELKIDAALRRRDLPGAAALLAEVNDPALAGALPVVRALATARPIAARGLDAVALPPGGPLVAAVVGEDTREITLLGRSLAPARSFRGAERVFPTAGGWALTRVGEQIRLIDMTAPEVPRLAFHGRLDAYPQGVIDVGDDGRLDLFFFHQSPDRGFKRISDLAGAPAVRTAHAGSERAVSDFHSIVAGDLDGDGTQEVVASFGGWRAYDVRVFHGDDAGELQLVSRAQVGRVPALGLLRRPGGGLALIAAKDGDRNPAVFPEPPHVGIAPGVYLFEWTGSELIARAHTCPPSLTAPGFIDRPVVADLDGDGTEEFAVRLAADDAHHTMVVRQERGGLSSFVIGHVGITDALELDGDPAREVLAIDVKSREVWALGVGEEPLPPRSDAGSEPEPPPPWLVDEVLRERWTRAEVLERIGLPGGAAAALRDASALALEPTVRRRLLARAAERFAAAGELESALAVGADVEDDPELGPEALRRRVEILTDLGRFPEAAAAARSLLGHPRRASALAVAAQVALDRLAPLLDPGRAAELRFDGPLSPAWRIDRPIALSRDPVAGALRVAALSSHERLAALPVRWAGGPAQIEVELEVERAEWFTRVSVALVDANGVPWLGGGAGAGGARGGIHHSALCRSTGLDNITLSHRPIDTAATRHRVTVRAVYFPDRAAVECAIDDEGKAVERRKLRADSAPAPGVGTLVITGHGPSTAPHLVSMAIRRISLRGVQIDESTPALGVADVAARALVEGEPGEVLARLAGSAESWPQRAALELLAYDALRDAAGVARTIEAGLAALDDDDAALLLRTRPTLALAARGALGPRLVPTLARAWLELGDMHRGDQGLERELLAELRGIEGLTPADAAQREQLAGLLALRAGVRERGGAVERARRDYAAALAVLGATGGDSTRSRLHPALALVLLRSDPEAAREHAAQALAHADSPELLQDRLRSHPAVAELAGRDPAWQALLTARLGR